MAKMIRVVRLPLNDLKYFRIQKPVPLVEIQMPISRGRSKKRRAHRARLNCSGWRHGHWAYNPTGHRISANASPAVKRRLSACLLFVNIIGRCQKRRGNVDAKLFGAFNVQDNRIFRRIVYRQITGFCPV
jgi:hypothetical protein